MLPTVSSPREPANARLGFTQMVPLPMRWARATTWARRSRVQPPSGLAISAMRRLERLNRG